MATKAALATFELLENCLSHLEFHDLLAAKAVSQEWRAVAMRSLSLRKTLYLASTSDTLLEVDLAITTTDKSLGGPFLTRYPLSTHPIFLTHHYNHITNTTRRCGTCNLFRLSGPGREASTSFLFTWPLDIVRKMAKSELHQSMLLTQPACTVVQVMMERSCFIVTGERLYDRSLATLRVSDGVRFQAITSAVEDMMRDFRGPPRGSIEVQIRFQVKGLRER
ncbi:hypothetical protein LTS10_011053 [Elasticomyces elasticus]|nr:hypothetical protein LTS10_011053 [Elasticomyces elasticus]